MANNKPQGANKRLVGPFMIKKATKTTSGPHKLKKPESGGTPKKITTKGTPGGPHTPGAKAKRAKEEEEAKKRARATRDASINKRSR